MTNNHTLNENDDIMKNKTEIETETEEIATPETHTLQQQAAFTMLIAGGVLLAVGVFIQLITSSNKKLIETTNPYDPSITLEEGIKRLRVLDFAIKIHSKLIAATAYQMSLIVSGSICTTAGIAPRFFNTKKQDRPNKPTPDAKTASSHVDESPIPASLKQKTIVTTHPHLRTTPYAGYPVCSPEPPPAPREQVAERNPCELLQPIDIKEGQATSSSELVKLKQEKKEKIPELDQILADLFQTISKILHKEQQTVTDRLLLDFYNQMDRHYQDYLRTGNYTEFALDCRCLATSVQLSKLATQVPVTYGIDSEIVFYLCKLKKPYYYEFDNRIKPLVDFCRNVPLRQTTLEVNSSNIFVSN